MRVVAGSCSAKGCVEIQSLSSFESSLIVFLSSHRMHPEWAGKSTRNHPHYPQPAGRASAEYSEIAFTVIDADPIRGISEYWRVPLTQ